MISLLKPTEYHRVKAIFQSLEFNLTLPAILRQEIPGRIYVDDRNQPKIALAQYKHKIYLCGANENIALTDEWGAFLMGANWLLGNKINGRIVSQEQRMTMEEIIYIVKGVD